MDIILGKYIIASIADFDKIFGRLDEIIYSIDDQMEREVWRMHLGKVLKVVNEEVLQPVLRQYPELDPDTE